MRAGPTSRCAYLFIAAFFSGCAPETRLNWSRGSAAGVSHVMTKELTDAEADWFIDRTATPVLIPQESAERSEQ